MFIFVHFNTLAIMQQKLQMQAKFERIYKITLEKGFCELITKVFDEALA